MQRASTFVLAVFVASALLAGCGKEKALVFSFPRAPRIAFVSDRSGLPQIYIVNSDGTGLSRISSTPNSAAQPTWAPNGKAIAFSSVDYVHPAGDILVVSPNGTDQTNLTSNPGVLNFAPSWSPASFPLADPKIAFTTKRYGNFDVYVMNADGSSPRRLTTDPASDGSPIWSPRGDLIAFFSHRSGNADIWVMKPDGSAQTRLTNRQTPYEFGFAWSPDGTRIAYPDDRGGNVHVYVVAADGSKESRLTTDSLTDTDPAWSPDGRRIAYVRPDGIHVMNSDGSNDYWVPNTRSFDHSPVWSPDGRLIAFVNLENSQYDIFVISPTGEGRLNLSLDPGNDDEPTWEP